MFDPSNMTFDERFFETVLRNNSSKNPISDFSKLFNSVDMDFSNNPLTDMCKNVVDRETFAKDFTMCGMKTGTKFSSIKKLKSIVERGNTFNLREDIPHYALNSFYSSQDSYSTAIYKRMLVVETHIVEMLENLKSKFDFDYEKVVGDYKKNDPYKSDNMENFNLLDEVLYNLCVDSNYADFEKHLYAGGFLSFSRDKIVQTLLRLYTKFFINCKLYRNSNYSKMIFENMYFVNSSFNKAESDKDFGENYKSYEHIIYSSDRDSFTYDNSPNAFNFYDEHFKGEVSSEKASNLNVFKKFPIMPLYETSFSIHENRRNDELKVYNVLHDLYKKLEKLKTLIVLNMFLSGFDPEGVDFSDESANKISLFANKKALTKAIEASDLKKFKNDLKLGRAFRALLPMSLSDGMIEFLVNSWKGAIDVVSENTVHCHIGAGAYDLEYAFTWKYGANNNETPTTHNKLQVNSCMRYPLNLDPEYRLTNSDGTFPKDKLSKVKDLYDSNFDKVVYETGVHPSNTYNTDDYYVSYLSNKTDPNNIEKDTLLFSRTVIGLQKNDVDKTIHHVMAPLYTCGANYFNFHIKQLLKFVNELNANPDDEYTHILAFTKNEKHLSVERSYSDLVKLGVVYYENNWDGLTINLGSLLKYNNAYMVSIAVYIDSCSKYVDNMSITYNDKTDSYYGIISSSDSIPYDHRIESFVLDNGVRKSILEFFKGQNFLSKYSKFFAEDEADEILLKRFEKNYNLAIFYRTNNNDSSEDDFMYSYSGMIDFRNEHKGKQNIFREKIISNDCHFCQKKTISMVQQSFKDFKTYMSDYGGQTEYEISINSTNLHVCANKDCIDAFNSQFDLMPKKEELLSPNVVKNTNYYKVDNMTFRRLLSNNYTLGDYIYYQKDYLPEEVNKPIIIKPSYVKKEFIALNESLEQNSNSDVEAVKSEALLLKEAEIKKHNSEVIEFNFATLSKIRNFSISLIENNSKAYTLRIHRSDLKESIKHSNNYFKSRGFLNDEDNHYWNSYDYKLLSFRQKEACESFSKLKMSIRDFVRCSGTGVYGHKARMVKHDNKWYCVNHLIDEGIMKVTEKADYYKECEDLNEWFTFV